MYITVYGISYTVKFQQVRISMSVSHLLGKPHINVMGKSAHLVADHTIHNIYVF